MPALFRLACCMCGKPVPLSGDVYGLDAEWQRRYPDLRGMLACDRCALHTGWPSCEVRSRTGPGRAERLFVPGHIPAAGRGPDFDAWSHVLGQGTHVGMVQKYPRSALLQGAEPYLRAAAVRRTIAPAVGERLRALLAQWDAAAVGERLERFGRAPAPTALAPAPASGHTGGAVEERAAPVPGAATRGWRTSDGPGAGCGLDSRPAARSPRRAGGAAAPFPPSGAPSPGRGRRGL